jgi:hypothetical protein
MNLVGVTLKSMAGPDTWSRQDPAATVAGAGSWPGLPSAPSGRCVKAGQREASAVVR